MRIMAIDPGNVESAYVIVEVSGDGSVRCVLDKGKVDSASIHLVLDTLDPTSDRVLCEMVASYGMPVGRTVFET